MLLLKSLDIRCLTTWKFLYLILGTEIKYMQLHNVWQSALQGNPSLRLTLDRTLTHVLQLFLIPKVLKYGKDAERNSPVWRSSGILSSFLTLWFKCLTSRIMINLCGWKPLFVVTCYVEVGNSAHRVEERARGHVGRLTDLTGSEPLRGCFTSTYPSSWLTLFLPTSSLLKYRRAWPHSEVFFGAFYRGHE